MTEPQTVYVAIYHRNFIGAYRTLGGAQAEGARVYEVVAKQPLNPARWFFDDQDECWEIGGEPGLALYIQATELGS